MANLGRRSRRSTVDLPTRQLAGQHLLLLPTTVPVEVVSECLRDRVPESDLAGTGEVTIGRRSSISGPYHFSLEEAVEAGVPMPWTYGYALDAPVEREGPPLGGMDDRDGFAFAFPAGLPWREEGRGLHLLVGLARRLRGVVRTGGDHELITPDPDRAVDFVVHSPVALEPEVLLRVVSRELPGARLAVEGQDYVGPPPEVYTGEAFAHDTGHDPLSTGELAVLHDVADRKDDASLSIDWLDGYAVVVPLPQPRAGQSVPPTGRGDGAVEILVHAGEGHETAVAGEPWVRAPFTVYEVRWDCPDPADRERRRPSAALLASRERARPWLSRLARAVVEATSGVVVDEDGFRVDRYAL